MGSIITFYSYKGGVGRTMALANIAVLLAQMGLKVLAVDWDLEAPGLDRYFRDYMPPNGDKHLGLIDLLFSASEDNTNANWHDYKMPINIQRGTSLSLITSGRRDEGYVGKVLSFEWDYFFSDCGGGDFIESLREGWTSEFDVTLIDSRTGITDSGGICTIQLPDILALVFTANSQSLDGIKDVAKRAQIGRQMLAYDRMPLTILPLPSRFDSRAQFEESQEWLRTFARELQSFYDDWLPKRYNPLQILQRTKLPYVAFFSFGEKLPVIDLDDYIDDPEGLGYAYDAVTKLIFNQFKTEVIDEIFGEARSVSISGDANHARIVADELHLEKISIDTQLIQSINADLEAVKQVFEAGFLSDRLQVCFYLIRREIQSLKLYEFNVKISEIGDLARNSLEVAKEILYQKRGLELIDADSLTCIDQQIEIVQKLQIDLEEATELAEWIDHNRKEIARRIGRKSLKSFPDTQFLLSQENVARFCFSLYQFLEQIAHCLRWGRPDILDSPSIPLELNTDLYLKAFQLIKKDLPSHVSEDARSQFEEYIDYLMERLLRYE